MAFQEAVVFVDVSPGPLPTDVFDRLVEVTFVWANMAYQLTDGLAGQPGSASWGALAPRDPISVEEILEHVGDLFFPPQPDPLDLAPGWKYTREQCVDAGINQGFAIVYGSTPSAPIQLPSADYDQILMIAVTQANELLAESILL